MPRSAKIAISLPIELVQRLEDRREETGETRSALIRRLLELGFEQRDKDRKIKAYVAGYQRHPEDEDEIDAAAANADILAREPW